MATTNGNKAYEPKNIGWADGVKLSEAQLKLLDQAYTGYAISTVVRQIATGKSGALVFLVERYDHRFEIAKFDHPYGLKPEVQAYDNLVMNTSPEYRVELRGGLFANEEQTLGVIIYNFLSQKKDSQKKDTADNSLLEYFNQHGGNATAEVLEHIFEAYGAHWWDSHKEATIWYSEEYDRLLPVHLTLQAIHAPNVQDVLQSGRIEWSAVRPLQINQTIRLLDFEITDCREGILRLQGRTPQPEHSPNLRVKLAGIDPAQFQPGQIIPEVIAQITATRAELLSQDAHQAAVIFAKDDREFQVQGKQYPSPLQFVELFLQEAPVVKSSIIHGDLNLRNIVVHERTGFAWLIDFFHTREGGPTLFDLQRLEDHAIAELLAPGLAQRNNPNDLVKILNALHSDAPSRRAPVKQWQEAYTVLYKIRQLAKRYLPRGGSWREYYRGLFLVFMGSLKFERTPYQRALLLVGAVTVKELMELPLTVPYKPKGKNSMQKWLLAIGGAVLLSAGIMIGVNAPRLLSTWVDEPSAESATAAVPLAEVVAATLTAWPTAVPTQTPLPTATAVPTATPMPTIALQDQWPPQNGTILARIKARGYLICGVAGDIPGFSNELGNSGTITFTTAKAGTQARLYDLAEGFDVDFCKAMAVAIFGQYEEKVVFLNLATSSAQVEGEPQVFERFAAVRDGLVDIAFRNTTWTAERELLVDFGPVIYYDGLKFILAPELVEGQQLNNAQETIEYLQALAKNICVLERTTTVKTLRTYFDEEQIITRDDKGEEFLTNGNAADTYLKGELCTIMASDESQLFALKETRERLKLDVIIPTAQGIAFEPLAPFVMQGDSQWLDMLKQVIWAIFYGEQVGIKQSDIKLLTLPNPSPEIDGVISQLVTQNETLSAQQYKDFLGIVEKSIAKEPPPAGFIRQDFALQIIAQVGNYGDIYTRNLGKLAKSPNCIWNPLKQHSNTSADLPADECRLVVPPR